MYHQKQDEKLLMNLDQYKIKCINKMKWQKITNLLDNTTTQW